MLIIHFIYCISDYNKHIQNQSKFIQNIDFNQLELQTVYTNMYLLS